MMEEYTKNEEEANFELQSEDVQENRPEARTKTELENEETRKIRRGAEEAEVKQRKEKVSDFVSERAYFTWKDKLQYKDFIGKRGFNKLISPFVETIEKKG